MRKLMTKYKQLPVQVRASFWFLICAFVQRGLSVLTTPIFTRLLTPQEYGQFSVFNSWLNVVTILVSLNLYAGVYMQGLVKFDREQATFSSSMQGLTVVLASGWTAGYLLFRTQVNQLLGLPTVQVLAMLVIIWAGAAFNFWSVAQRAAYRYRRLVAMTLLVTVSQPVVGIWLVVHAQDKVTARIVGLALVQLIAYVGFFFIQMRRGRRFFSARFWKYAICFNVPLLPHFLSQAVLFSSDRIMIDKMLGAGVAGIYTLASAISMLTTLFNDVLLQTLEPWMYRKIKAGRAGDISRVALPALGMIAAINIGFIAFAPELVAIFAPAAYLQAIWVMPPITMSVFFAFLYNFFVVFELYYEKTLFVTVATIAGAGLNLGLNFWLIPRLGFYAAGYTTLICYAAYALGHYLLMQRICHERLAGVRVYQPRRLLLIIGIFMSGGLLFLASYHWPLVRYGLIGVGILALFLTWRRLVTTVRDLIAVRRGDEAAE